MTFTDDLITSARERRLARQARERAVRESTHEHLSAMSDIWSEPYDAASRRDYAEARAEEVAQFNRELEQTMGELESLLTEGMSAGLPPFDSFKVRPVLPPWEPGMVGLTLEPPAPPVFPPPPTGLAKRFGGKAAAHEAEVARLQQEYQRRVEAHRAAEAGRLQRLLVLRADHEANVEHLRSATEGQHQQVDTFLEAFTAGDIGAVLAYLTLVLETTLYPEGFPQSFKLAYVQESRQLVCEYDLPAASVVPKEKSFKRIASTDTITSTARPVSQIKSTYASVVAQVALRTVHELFAADGPKVADTIVFNGMVDAIDPATGRQIRPCLITLRTTRDQFGEFDLSRVDPLACLRSLSAGVSKSPAEPFR